MNFDMIGKLTISKETDKFKPYQETVYDSGWERKRLLFNAICGDNRHTLTINAGAFTDGHGDIYTFTKGGQDANGNKIKGESVKIPFKERLTSPKLAEIAEFKKFILDLEVNGRRRLIEQALTKVKEGTGVTDEDLNKIGISDVSQLEDALAESKNLRREFISEWDFVDAVRKMIESGKYANKKFLIRGSSDYSYNDDKKQIYDSLIPTRIYLADDDAEEYSKCDIKFLFGSDAIDDSFVDEKGKYYINGWIMEYENNRKSNIPIPVSFTISASEDEKKLNALKKKFTVDEDDKIYEYGIICNMLDGAQKTEITMDMLSEETQEDIECGLITFEEAVRELGGNVYGDRIKEWQFSEIGRGYKTKGKEATAYTKDNMVITPLGSDDLTDGLFDDEDDDI